MKWKRVGIAWFPINEWRTVLRSEIGRGRFVRGHGGRMRRIRKRDARYDIDPTKCGTVWIRGLFTYA